MLTDRQRELLAEFNPALDLADAHTAPASWYADPGFFELEKQVLKNSWQFVAPLKMLSEPGRFVSGEFLGEPYVILKDETGEIRAFYNVCRHHAACLVSGDGQIPHLACPYHGWTYSLKGELMKAPHLGAIKNFDKKKMALVPIPVKVAGPFVLLNFSGRSDSILDKWAPLFSKLQESGYEKLHFVERREYEIKCNWKVYVDNYLDGGYHVGILHKGLAGQLDLNEYTVENFDRWTLQSCKSGQGDTKGDFKERLGEGAFYGWIHPNFMINRYGPIMDTNWVVPKGHDRCTVVFDYFFADPSNKKFIDDSIKASDRVQQEDTYICESVQRGVSSSAYKSGRYGVTESGMHLFHKWLHAEITSAD